MATHAVADGEVGAWEKSLTAATVDTVNFDDDRDEVRVTNVSGTAAIYYRLDGTAPVVGAAACFWLPAVAGATRSHKVQSGANTQVKLISSGTPSYSVEGSL